MALETKAGPGAGKVDAVVGIEGHAAISVSVGFRDGRQEVSHSQIQRARAVRAAQILFRIMYIMSELMVAHLWCGCRLVSSDTDGCTHQHILSDTQIARRDRPAFAAAASSPMHVSRLFIVRVC